MSDLPAHEQLALTTDRPRVERWIQLNPEASTELSVDRDAFDSNQGHVLLVVRVRNVEHLDRARTELTSLVKYPDRLRVRRWKPTSAETERVMRWIMETHTGRRGGPGTVVTAVGIDAITGLVNVSLDRPDDVFAAELRAATSGIVDVRPEPPDERLA